MSTPKSRAFRAGLAFPRPLRSAVASARAALAALALLAGLVPGLSATASAQRPADPGALFAAVEASLAELPRDRFELAAVVEAVRATSGGDTVAGLFGWVRDETGLVPYRGALKGPAGVLMDRAGNSLDRALLLRELLLASGEQAVLATAQLDAAGVEAVVAALRPAPAEAATVPSADELAQRLASEYGADLSATSQRLAQAEAQREQLLSTLSDATQAQAAELRRLLGDVGAGAGAPATAALVADQLVADHWWVQVMREGQWVDLDPTLPGATPGQTLTATTTATGRFGPTALAQLAAVEGACRDLTCGDRLHTVRVRAISERWDGEALSQEVLLDVELLPAELIDTQVAFHANPKDWPEELDLFGTSAPLDALRAALLETTAWEPALAVGEAVHGNKVVNDDGTVAERAGSGGVGGLGGGVGGMFGGFGGGGGSSGGEFTALWLEFEVRTPGHPVTVERRQVFDLVGPALRAAGGAGFAPDEASRLTRAVALAGMTEIAVQAARTHPAVASAVAAQRLLASSEAWAELYRHGEAAPPEVLGARLDDMAALVTPLEAFALLRSEAARDLDAAGAATYEGGLVVTAHHRAIGLDLMPYSGFDLVYSATASLAGAGALVSGVMDSNLEALMTRRLDPLLAGEAPHVDAVAEAFAADLAAGRPWLLVTDAAGLDAAAPDLSPDLRQRVQVDLEAGHLALVPAGGAGAVGWWRVDPLTGRAVGMGDRGWGQAMTEYDVVTNVVLQLRTVLNQYASMARCLGIALTMPLRGETGVTKELGECVFTLVCGSLNTAINTIMVTETNWTNVILSATIDAAWGGVPEVGSGSFCQSLWNRASGG